MSKGPSYVQGLPVHSEMAAESFWTKWLSGCRARCTAYNPALKSKDAGGSVLGWHQLHSEFKASLRHVKPRFTRKG